MNDILYGILQWIKEDWKSNKFRFIIEVIAWAISIGCSLVMAVTVPDPPLVPLYCTWIFGCSLYAWAAFTRRSFGMLANYCVLVGIDSVGLLRMLIS